MQTFKSNTENKMAIGIDPGITGAIALVKLSNGNPSIVDIRDMPVVASFKADSSIRRRVDPTGLGIAVKGISGGETIPAYVEHVSASPGMGVSSAFSFGHTAGTIGTVLSLLGHDTAFVSPSVWKRAMGVPADKAATVERATQIFGGEAALKFWPLKKHHNRAEAALIALYGLKGAA